jgi:hypothetical protein
MTIQPDVQAVAETFSAAPSFVQLVQAVCNAEGDILRAVQCSQPEIVTRVDALRVLCRSIVHRMSDYVKAEHGADFVGYFGSKWAPVGATNDPNNLNTNWVTNVSAFWDV